MVIFGVICWAALLIGIWEQIPPESVDTMIARERYGKFEG